jgi:hypothetical protein
MAGVKLSVVSASLVALIGHACQNGPDNGLAVGAPWPSGLMVVDSQPTLIWITTVDQCLTCQSVGYNLRHIKEEFPQLDVNMVTIGTDSDKRIVEEHVTTMRLDVDGTLVSATRFRGLLGSSRTPALVLVVDRMIRWRMFGGGPLGNDFGGLDDLVGHLRNVTLSVNPNEGGE